MGTCGVKFHPSKYEVHCFQTNSKLTGQRWWLPRRSTLSYPVLEDLNAWRHSAACHEKCQTLPHGHGARMGPSVTPRCPKGSCEQNEDATRTWMEFDVHDSPNMPKYLLSKVLACRPDPSPKPVSRPFNQPLNKKNTWCTIIHVRAAVKLKPCFSCPARG